MLLTTNSGAFQNLSSWAPRAMISRDRNATVVLIRIFSYDKCGPLSLVCFCRVLMHSVWLLKLVFFVFCEDVTF